MSQFWWVTWQEQMIAFTCDYNTPNFETYRIFVANWIANAHTESTVAVGCIIVKR